MAHRAKKHCPSHKKTLPIVSKNVARKNLKPRATFFISLPILFPSCGQRFFPQPPGVPLRSAPGFEPIGPSARMDYPNRRAVISTQPWVKPIGGTHGQVYPTDKHPPRIAHSHQLNRGAVARNPIYPPLCGSNKSGYIYRGLHPRLYSHHTYGVKDTHHASSRRKHPK